MKTIFEPICLSLAIILISACAITTKSGNEYGDAPTSKPLSKSWLSQVENYELAIESNAFENASVGSQAITWYEYGRALGVVCRFEESEAALLKSNTLDDLAGQPLFYSFTELARLRLDQNDFSQASIYFQKALMELDKVNARQQSPIAYADILQDYSTSLQNEGRVKMATQLFEQSSVIRQNNPGRFSTTDRTPYGSECH